MSGRRARGEEKVNGVISGVALRAGMVLVEGSWYGLGFRRTGVRTEADDVRGLRIQAFLR